MTKWGCFFLVIVLCGCVTSPHKRKTHERFLDEQTYELSHISSDKNYGYSYQTPIKVGGVRSSEGPQNQLRYLNALLGPNNEPIMYNHIGSCCDFRTRNSEMGMAQLDSYQLFWEGGKDTLIVYINMYDADKLYVPAGLNFKR